VGRDSPKGKALYRNQYLIAETPLAETPGLEFHKFGSLSVYHHKTLAVTEASGRDCQLLSLGYLLDPFTPEASNLEVLRKLSQAGPDLEALLRSIASISGRFVIVYRSGDQLAAFSDALAQRQLYASLDGSPVLTSSPKLFLDLYRLSPRCSSEKLGFMSQPEFVKNEAAWFGASCPEDRLTKILPNHYLDLASKSIRRMPFPKIGRLQEQEVVDFAGQVLSGSIRAMTNDISACNPSPEAGTAELSLRRPSRLARRSHSASSTTRPTGKPASTCQRLRL